MKTIVLKNGYFGKKPVIRLEFPFDFQLKEMVRTYPECQWDPKQKVWWVFVFPRPATDETGHWADLQAKTSKDTLKVYTGTIGTRQ